MSDCVPTGQITLPSPAFVTPPVAQTTVFSAIGQANGMYGPGNFLGVKNEESRRPPVLPDCVIEALPVPLAYISNKSPQEQKNYPKAIYSMQTIDLCLSDLRTLFFSPVSNKFAVNILNKHHPAFAIKGQYMGITGAKTFKFDNAVIDQWVNSFGGNRDSIPSHLLIQLIRASSLLSSWQPMARFTSGLSFDEVVESWMESGPSNNILIVQVTVYFEYDPLQVAIELIYTYKIILPGSNYGGDEKCLSTILATASSFSGGDLEILPTDCPCGSGGSGHPNGNKVYNECKGKAALKDIIQKAKDIDVELPHIPNIGIPNPSLPDPNEPGNNPCRDVLGEIIDKELKEDIKNELSKW
jgi:hypothetical protein